MENDAQILAEALDNANKQVEELQRQNRADCNRLGATIHTLKWEKRKWTAFLITYALVLSLGAVTGVGWLGYKLLTGDKVGPCRIEAVRLMLDGYTVYREIDWRQDTKLG